MSDDSYRYWDACAFLGWFNAEEDKVDECESVLKAAQSGQVTIVTSAMTLTEVVKIKGKQPLSERDEETIKQFFENKFIKVTNLDRFVSEYARNLIWKYSHLKPKDAVHLASALTAECPYLDTFDDDLLKINERLEGVLMHIGRPSLPNQRDLGLKEREYER